MSPRPDGALPGPRLPRGPGAAALRILDGAVDVALALGVAASSLAILVQVFFRYVLDAPIAWAEEFAVLVFAWVIFLGSARVQRTDSHISIDTLRRLAGPRAGRWLDALRLAALGFVGVVLIWQGAGLASRTVFLRYPAMEISRAWLYASVPVCFAIGLVYVLRSARRVARGEPPGAGAGAGRAAG